jgi:hypothetical protein
VAEHDEEEASKSTRGADIDGLDGVHEKRAVGAGAGAGVGAAVGTGVGTAVGAGVGVGVGAVTGVRSA